MVFKTSSIDLNVPAKVLPCTVTTVTAQAFWQYDDGLGDAWWSGGGSPKPYRWEVILDVTQVSHGSHLTRTPYLYDGFDVVVGDYIAGATDGKALQIISISEKSETIITCIVEDKLRYNTFRNASGIGIFNAPGTAVIFQTNEYGDPMLDPLPTGIVSTDFYANISSRFKYLNPQNHFVLEKNNNNFEPGDVIAVSASGFELASPENLDKLVGTVTHSGPGPHQFMLRPLNGVIDLVPGLPGELGDFIYPMLDGSGDLTTENTGVAMFLKLKDSVPSTAMGTVRNATTAIGNVLELNSVQITFSGSTIDSAVTAINNQTGAHKVTATKVQAPNIAISDPLTNTSAYGLIGGHVPFSASINGITVNFTTPTIGQAAYGQAVAVAEDMATDINAANIPNIVAYASQGKLFISNTSGGTITIGNIGVDAMGNTFAGNNSITSLSNSYPSVVGDFVLVLSRSDGGEIIMSDIVGFPSYDFGIVSGHNGSYAIGLNVEQGIRKTGTTVVSDLAARDSLPRVLVGDQAYVLDAGNGEWALFIWDGAGWITIATHDSAATDANTLSATVDLPAGEGSITVDLGSISDGSKVVSAVVEVTDPVTGATSTPSLTIGYGTQTDRLMSADQNDIETAGSYTTTPSFHYIGEGELAIIATLLANGATSGSVKITVTYV